MHILLKDLLKEQNMENVSHNDTVNKIIVYHAGPHNLKVNDIIFDRGALGFHVGTLSQAQDFSSGWAKKGNKNAPISKFILNMYSRNKGYIEDLNHDMPWEHADLLLLQLVHHGILNYRDAERLAIDWGIVTDSFYDSDYEENENIFLTKLKKAMNSMNNPDFAAGDEVGFNLSSEYYKNPARLGELRKVLNEQGYIGFKYPNEVEGKKGEFSYCILDKSALQDIE